MVDLGNEPGSWVVLTTRTFYKDNCRPYHEVDNIIKTISTTHSTKQKHGWENKVVENVKCKITAGTLRINSSHALIWNLSHARFDKWGPTSLSASLPRTPQWGRTWEWSNIEEAAGVSVPLCGIFTTVCIAENVTSQPINNQSVRRPLNTPWHSDPPLSLKG